MPVPGGGQPTAHLRREYSTLVNKMLSATPHDGQENIQTGKITYSDGNLSN